MNIVYPYLSFNGNCREAMTFYQQCLGGKLYFQTIGESPNTERLPARMKKCILHAELRSGEFIIMGSDMVGENGLKKGNAVTLMLNCKNEKGIKTCYHNLSRGGDQTHPLGLTHWGSLFGGVTDKYGFHWLLTIKK